jgi:drug/metabolite transporter (DMT)-like permease
MTLFALILVLTAALLHAFWNLMAKRASGSLPFIWLLMVISVILYTPVALGFICINRPTFQPVQFVFIVGSSLLHLAYFVVLSRGYRTGDLSLVYPLARGTGPMLSTVGAVLLFGERPSLLAIGGIVCIGVGIFMFTGGMRIRKSAAGAAIAYALLTGATIAAYTLWDKYAVSTLLTAPLLYQWMGDVVQIPFLTLMMRGRWHEARREWQIHRLEALTVAIFSPLAYILVLIALTVTPVSYIAPLREVSILIGAVMGTLLLSEGNTRRRWSAASVVVVGVIALALG